MPGGRRRPQIYGPRAVDRCEDLLFAGADAGIRAEAPLPRRSRGWLFDGGTGGTGGTGETAPAGCLWQLALLSLWEASTARLEAANSRGSETCLPGECVWARWAVWAVWCAACNPSGATLPCFGILSSIFLSSQKRLNWESARSNSRSQANVQGLQSIACCGLLHTP